MRQYEHCMIVAICVEENCIYAGIHRNYILNCTLYMHERSSGRGNIYIYYIYIYIIQAP